MRDERKKKLVYMVALAQLILNLPPLLATMLLFVVVVVAATLRSPALRGMKLVVAIIYHGRLMEPKNGAGSGFRIFIL